MEIWKRIIVDGVETDYEVSDLAVVRLIDGAVVLKQTASATEYNGVKKYQNTVRLKIGDTMKMMYVKILVATAHCERKDGDNTVVRKEGDSDHASNLEWTTKSKVMSASHSGRMPTGKDHWNFGKKVSDRTKKKMRLARKGKSKYKGKLICEGRAFDTATAAAKFFKISGATVTNRVNSENKEWAAWYLREESKQTTI